jgi:hypothetical protein
LHASTRSQIWWTDKQPVRAMLWLCGDPSMHGNRQHAGSTTTTRASHLQGVQIATDMHGGKERHARAWCRVCL